MGAEKERDRAPVRSAVFVAVLLVLSAAAFVNGYVRNTRLMTMITSLSAQQAQLEECAQLAAEFSALRRRQIAPGEQAEYVRTLMEDAARQLGIRGSLGKITEVPVGSTGRLRETKYGVELKGVSLQDVVIFLHKIQNSGKNLVPAELSMRRHGASNRWTAHVAVNAVSVVK